MLALSALLLAVPAAGQGYAFPIDIRAQSLSAALRDLARQTGSELLYDRNLLRGMRAPPVRSRLTIEAGLQRLLAGTGLTTRRAASGAWVIERPHAPAPSGAPQRVPPAVDLATPEILVTAQLSQNADIRRRENDIQPYQVTSREEIVRAHRDNLDQYFRSRVTGNTQAVPPSLLDDGATNFQIDLRGLGTARTMILVDGRRMPGVLDINAGVAQPDINAIPLHAIERVETLTGTAGGIHGFGALGGVVNVVLRRDYRGAELHAIGGISARGDAERLALEGRVGFTPDEGRTDVMLAFGWSSEGPLLAGQRDYRAKDRQRTYDGSRELMLILNPRLNGVLAVGPLGYGTLSLKPEYGGGEFGSGFAFLPRGFDGNPSGLFAALTQNAGQPDLGLTEAEAASQMGASADTLSAIASLRHDFGGGVEGYVDGLYLRNRGQTVSHAAFGTITMSPDVPQNPFTDFVTVSFPTTPEDDRVRTVFASARLTAGLIVPLWHDWRATAEASFGRSSYDWSRRTDHHYNGLVFLFGFPGDDPEFTPFGNWDDFQRALDPYLSDDRSASMARDRNQEQSLRLAGPLFETGGGPATLTLQAKRRRDEVPPYSVFSTDVSEGAIARSIAEESLHAELKAPIFGDAAPVPLLDGLELQLAVRHDRQRYLYTSTYFEPPETDAFRFSGTAFTAGAKVSPLPWLMLRGSYATGLQPPSPELLLKPTERESDRLLLEDPRRGNAWFTDEGSYRELSGGNPELEEVEASTLSLGAVFNPFGDNAPRLSLDYSRIDTKGEPFAPLSVLAHEDLWPERVIREPLADEDRALGYTGGRILLLDASVANAGRIEVETLDALLDWSVPFLGGRLRTYGAATWQIGNALAEPAAVRLERVGYAGSPLKWRANGGFDFTRGALTLGANLQYFGRYRVYAPDAEFVAPDFVAVQGSEWVESRAYLDLYASRRFRIGEVEASLDFGVVNLFDQAPPYQADPYNSAGAGYSMHGDPRRRRFELVLSAEF